MNSRPDYRPKYERVEDQWGQVGWHLCCSGLVPHRRSPHPCHVAARPDSPLSTRLHFLLFLCLFVFFPTQSVWNSVKRSGGDQAQLDAISPQTQSQGWAVPMATSRRDRLGVVQDLSQERGVSEALWTGRGPGLQPPSCPSMQSFHFGEHSTVLMYYFFMTKTQSAQSFAKRWHLAK